MGAPSEDPGHPAAGDFTGSVGLTELTGSAKLTGSAEFDGSAEFAGPDESDDHVDPIDWTVARRVAVRTAKREPYTAAPLARWPGRGLRRVHPAGRGAGGRVHGSAVEVGPGPGEGSPTASAG